MPGPFEVQAIMSSSSSQSRGSERAVKVIAHLSGRYRGKVHRLTGDRITIGTGADDDVRFSTDDLTPGLSELPPSGPYAVLERVDRAYVLRASPEADVWVNGRRVEERALASGDVLEIGEGGPVLRFRVYPPGSAGHKSVSEVFSDCAACVRHGRGAVDRAGVLIAGPPMELLTRTTPWVRIASAVAMVALLAAVAALWTRSARLERRLLHESRAVRGLAEILERGESAALSDAEIEFLRGRLSDNAARIEALEARSTARAEVIERSARSVAFIQGAWGFEDDRGRSLRFARVPPDGRSPGGPEGLSVDVEGDGPPVEILYTGTGFVVDAAGLLLTNRHVAAPWETDETAMLLAVQGLTPVIRRFHGYLPGIEEPFDLTFVRASDTLDVALLRCAPVDADIPPLRISSTPARPGDEVIVLGYPTGITALVARADPASIQALREAGPLDFWEVARHLSAGGMIGPLATVGVVGQVTSGSVVYDAETTHGGSGGPVLSLDGEVLAVNMAILEEFGGSNLGVPAAEALRLLHAPPIPDAPGGRDSGVEPADR
jgi:S1-C subfamily serine protease